MKVLHKNPKNPINEDMRDSFGMVHSIETCGAVDGPGLRTVVFLEGCHLKCAYCSNKDMLDIAGYKVYDVNTLVNLIKPYTDYYKNGGGVTISGGDPVFQPEFVKSFLKECKRSGIHTALDTSFFTSKEVIDAWLPYTDLFMISLKHFDNNTHKKLTEVSNIPILENITYLNERLKKYRNTRIWFRYVIFPGFTDTNDNLSALINFIKGINFELIELLPYHTLGKYKWEKLGLSYPLESVSIPTRNDVLKIKERLEKEKFKVLIYE